MLLYVITYKFI